MEVWRLTPLQPKPVSGDKLLRICMERDLGALEGLRWGWGQGWGAGIGWFKRGLACPGLGVEAGVDRVWGYRGEVGGLSVVTPIGQG